MLFSGALFPIMRSLNPEAKTEVCVAHTWFFSQMEVQSYILNNTCLVSTVHTTDFSWQKSHPGSTVVHNRV